jgi:competence protein ComEC
MLKVLLPFMLGIIISDQYANKFNPHLLWALAPLLLLSSLSHLFLASIRYQKRVHSCSNLLVCILLGSYIASSNNVQQQANYLGNYHDSNAMVIGQIIAPIKETENTYKITINGLVHYSPKQNQQVNGKAFVYVYKKGNAQLFKEGDTIIVPNRWQAIRNTGNPFSFNYAQYCARKNIYLQQFITAQQIICFNQLQQASLLQRLQQFCIHNLDQHINDDNTRALLKAMLLGDETEIDPNMRQTYSDTGIIHIVSISGAHVALLFAAISFALGWIKQQRFAIIKYLFGLILVWVYVFLAGAATPALRAAILFSIISIATITKQQRNPLNELMSAAMLMLLFEPMWLFQIGFQLSFLAVLSLMIFYKPIVQCWSINNRLGIWVWKSIATSIAAEILIAPLVAYYFHGFPPMFLIANLIAGLSMGIILIFGLVLMIVGKISVVGTILGILITYAVQAFHYCIGQLQGLSVSAFKTIYLSFGGMLLLYGFILGLADWQLQKRKNSLSIALSALCLFAALSFRRSWHIAQQERLIVYNSSKTTQCEVLHGFNYSVISGATTEDYTTRNAHIGYGTSHISSKKENNFIINNKRICLLDSTTLVPNTWTTDLLIICANGTTTNPAVIIKSIQTNKIVLGNGLTNMQVKHWQSVCAQANIPVHVVKQEGAFVLPE